MEGRKKWVLCCCNCAVVNFSCGWREETRVKQGLFMRERIKKRSKNQD